MPKRMRWPDKKKPQKVRDQEHDRDQLQAIVSRMSEEALDLFSALHVLDAWDDPQFAPLVRQVDRELSAAVSEDGDLGARRVRPRLPLWASSNVSAPEREQAHRTLMKALGHDLPDELDDEPEPADASVFEAYGLKAPDPKRTAAHLRQKLRPRQDEVAAPIQKATERNCGFERPRRRPRLKSSPARPAATQVAQPARVETDPAKNPWLYDERLWA